MENIRTTVHHKLIGLDKRESEIIDKLLSLALDTWDPNDSDYTVVEELYYNW